MCLRRTASLKEKGWPVEVSVRVSGRRPLGSVEALPSVVVSSFLGIAKPGSASAWMKDDDDDDDNVVLLMSLV